MTLGFTNPLLLRTQDRVDWSPLFLTQLFPPECSAPGIAPLAEHWVKFGRKGTQYNTDSIQAVLGMQYNTGSILGPWDRPCIYVSGLDHAEWAVRYTIIHTWCLVIFWDKENISVHLEKDDHKSDRIWIDKRTTFYDFLQSTGQFEVSFCCKGCQCSFSFHIC